MDTQKFFSSVISYCLIIFIGTITSSPIFSKTDNSLGVFINKNKIFLYTSADRQGKIYHTARPIPFRVVDTEIEEDRLMLQIEFPFRTNKVSRTGYVIYPEYHIASVAQNSSADTEFMVFDEIPTQENNYPLYTKAPAKNIKYTGVVGESTLFINTKWYEVSFQKTSPFLFWVDASKGVYREFGSLKTAENLLKSVRNYPEDIGENLLTGNILQGYNKKEVLLAMGKPENVIKLESESEAWYYPLFSLEFTGANRVAKIKYY